MSDARVGKDRNSGAGARLITGLFLAPIIGCLVGSGLFVISNIAFESLATDSYTARQHELWYILGYVAIYSFQISIVIGVPVSFVFGLAIHVALERASISNLLAYAGAGAALGIIALELFLLSRGDGASFEYGIPVLGGLCGGLSALTFWFIRRPDRDALSAPPTP